MTDLRARLAWENDGVKIVGTFAAFYAVYLLMGWLIGFGLRGQLSGLVELTVLASIYVLLALALNLHWGYTGLFNIGIAGFMAVGAYTMAMVSKPVAAEQGAAQFSGLGLPFFVGLLAGIAAAALLGLVVALPALRLRADYLAIVTIAMSEIVRFFYQSGEFQRFTLLGRELGTGGGRGLILNFQDPLQRYVIDSPAYAEAVAAVDEAAGVEGSLEPVLNNALYALVLLALVAGYYWLLKRTGESPFGRVLKAIREDEDVARALGKDTDRFKVLSFMLGCALMGLAGALLMLVRGGSVTPNAFRPELTFFVWVALILGGAGSNTGSVLGGIVFVGVLFQGPLYLKNVVERYLVLGDTPQTIGVAAGELLALDPGPLLAYTLDQIQVLRLVALGVVLVWLMKRRPQGLLGHRKETAASIPLTRERQPSEEGGQ